MFLSGMRAPILVTILLVGLVVPPVAAGYILESTLDDLDYTFFPIPTAWEPGTNSARVGGHPSPGGATFSVMGSGFADASGLDTDHGTYTTIDITGLGVPGYGAADYAADINAALNIWASVSLFTNLGQVADGAVNAGAPQAIGGHLGDIRVAAWEITTTGVLAHAYQPGTEALLLGATIGGDVHFDVDRTWLDDPFDVTGNGMFDLFTVALHELGHSLGLGHSSVVGSAMEPFYGGARRTLHADDIAGIQALYGIPEPATIVLLGFGSLALIRRKAKI